MRLLRVIKTRKGKPLNLAKLEPKVASLCKKFDILLGASPQPCGADPRCGSGEDSLR